MSGRPTPAQTAARARNWRIRCLRSLHALCGLLTGERRSAARNAVDDELALIGAKTTAQHRAQTEEE